MKPDRSPSRPAGPCGWGQKRLTRVAVPGLLAVQAVLLAWGALRHSPTSNEVAHLPAGISHWRFSRFELYRVNPPLVRMVAALPVLVAGANTDWSHFGEGANARPEFAVARDFLVANGPRSPTLLGMDDQKRDFETGHESYLRGEWRMRGWWYYYLYASAIKIPLGTWLLGLVAFWHSVRHRADSPHWRDEIILFLPAIALFLLVSSQTGISDPIRYVLPCYALGFIWAGKAAQGRGGRPSNIARIVGGALIWSVASSLWVYPHSLGYFNELTGGPAGGPSHLLGSSVDWGQDLLYLRRWLDAHPAARPLALAFHGMYEPRTLGMEYPEPPCEPRDETHLTSDPDALGPRPGWYALSVTRIRTPWKQYTYFRSFKPAAMAGYSIYIYHVSPEEANRVRRELGLPVLPPPARRDPRKTIASTTNTIARSPTMASRMRK